MKSKVETKSGGKDLPDPKEVLRVMLNTPPQPHKEKQREENFGKKF